MQMRCWTYRLIQLSTLLYLFIATSSSTQAQVHASAMLDTNQVKIGEQMHLSLELNFPPGTRVSFPLLGDSMQNIEIIDRTKLDSIREDNGNLSGLRQTFTITCFDPGIYMISPFKFYYAAPGSAKPDSVLSEDLMIKVETVPVDTTKEIRDIKAPLEIPFSFNEISDYLVWGAIILFALIMIIYLLRRRKKKLQGFVAPKRPPHELALESLKKLREEKLWQQGLYKQYHSEVSDTVRTYIEGIFTIPAMELTTDETLDRLRRKGIDAELYSQLKYLLQLADTVKFAKAIPVATENEQSLQYAFEFVAKTKPATKDDVEQAVKDFKEPGQQDKEEES